MVCSMKRSTMPPHAATTTVVLVAMCTSAVGCGGMTPYNTKDDTEQVVEDAEEPPHIDNCPTLCNAAIGTYAPLGCDISCDIDLGTSVQAGIDVAVVNLLTLLWVDINGNVQTGETCDMVIECPDVSECQILALYCLSNSENEPAYCIDEYLQCQQETACTEVFTECADQAWQAYNDCTGTPAQCATLLDELNQLCSEQYANCLGAGEAPASPPPLPIQTGPGKWDVSRAFLQYHLARLGTLDIETFMMLVSNASGVPIGFELQSIENGGTLDNLGLQDGDVLVAVNDTSVMAFKSDPSVLLGLAIGSGVKLTIKRNGMTRHLRYRFTD